MRLLHFAFGFVSAALKQFQQMPHSPSADTPIYFIFLFCHGDLHQFCKSSWRHHTSAALNNNEDSPAFQLIVLARYLLGVPEPYSCEPNMHCHETLNALAANK